MPALKGYRCGAEVPVENKNSHQINWLILVGTSHYANIYASRDLGCLRDSARYGDRIGGQSVLNFSLLK